MKSALLLCLSCCLLPAAPVTAAFSWERLPTAHAGQLLYADAEGFAVRAGAELRLFSPEGALRRTVRFEDLGQGAVTVFPDAWALEIGGSPGVKVYGPDGRLRRAGSALEMTGQPYLPTRSVKQANQLWLEVYGGLAQVDAITWVPTYFAGGRLPDSVWGEESFTILRRLAQAPSPTAEEVVLERFTPQGVRTAALKLPLQVEAAHCLFSAYPVEQDAIVLSANDETLVLDRRTLAVRERFPWNSCVATCAVGVRQYAGAAWWRNESLGYSACATQHGIGSQVRMGERLRADSTASSPFAGVSSALQLPLGLAAAWDGAGRIYTEGDEASTGTRVYGFFRLSRTAVEGGGWRRGDLCQPLAFNLPVAGGTPPYSCHAPNGNPIPGCNYTRAPVADCAFGPQTEPLSVAYWVGDARGDRREARLTVLPIQDGGSPSAPAWVYEFRNALLNHYFMTINTFEREAIARGDAGPGWSELGARFLGWLPQFRGGEFFAPDGAVGSVAVCRFYGRPGVGPNSHFYTLAGRECEAVKHDPGWLYEAENTFSLLRPDVEGACPPWTEAVWRAYNNRHAQNDANHRYAVDRGMLDSMRSDGWVVEGVAFCAPRLLD